MVRGRNRYKRRRPPGCVGVGRRDLFRPYKEEVYPSLRMYWKIRLLH